MKKWIYGSSYINMKKPHNISLPFCSLWISLCHRFGSKAEAWVKVRQAVVGAVLIGLGGDADDILGGGTDGGGGKDGWDGDRDRLNRSNDNLANIILVM